MPSIGRSKPVCTWKAKYLKSSTQEEEAEVKQTLSLKVKPLKLAELYLIEVAEADVLLDCELNTLAPLHETQVESGITSQSEAVSKTTSTI